MKTMSTQQLIITEKRLSYGTNAGMRDFPFFAFPQREPNSPMRRSVTFIGYINCLFAFLLVLLKQDDEMKLPRYPKIILKGRVTYTALSLN